MNELIMILSYECLNSDGREKKAAESVLVNPLLFDLPVNGKSESDAVFRVRTPHRHVLGAQPGYVTGKIGNLNLKNTPISKVF